jgi:hypothetical protein
MSGESTRPRPVAPDSVALEICDLRIELVRSDPLIWRALEIPTSITLKTLNDIVQIAMGWDNAHLWEFTIAKQSYGPRIDDDGMPNPPRDAARVRLRDVLAPRRTRIDYLYDFGDSWEHRLIIDRVRPASPNVAYPRYVAGERNGPPEDSGGIPGFYGMLDVLADPTDPDHDHIAEWMGEYDPKIIDETNLKAGLEYLAKRIGAARKTARKRASKAK